MASPAAEAQKVRTLSFTPQLGDYQQLNLLLSRKQIRNVQIIYTGIGSLCLLIGLIQLTNGSLFSWTLIIFGVYILVIMLFVKKFMMLAMKPHLSGPMNTNLYAKRYFEIDDQGLSLFVDNGATQYVPWKALVLASTDENFALIASSRTQGFCVPRRAVPSDDDWDLICETLKQNVEPAN